MDRVVYLHIEVPLGVVEPVKTVLGAVEEHRGMLQEGEILKQRRPTLLLSLSDGTLPSSTPISLNYVSEYYEIII